ncbi:hypothetical protein EDD85DRAFT_866101 [Armillaria nabsnona]|nr:hypothetical protein EDD85DRAFT_866101 [Armillaria nabsnona]
MVVAQVCSILVAESMGLLSSTGLWTSARQRRQRRAGHTLTVLEDAHFAKDLVCLQQIVVLLVDDRNDLCRANSLWLS